MTFSFYSNKKLLISGQLLFVAMALMSGSAVQAQTKAAVLAAPSGTLIYSLNPNSPMIPASTLKLLTSLAALKTLGKSYRFTTQIAYNPSNQDLHLKGYGDPLFISEELTRLSSQIIARYSPKTINNIVMDTSFFSSMIEIPGTGQSLNPYDATTGALCANFNTFHFKWDPKQKRYTSAEPQTPFLEILLKDIQASGLKEGRILLDEKMRGLYAGLLIGKLLENAGVQISGRVISGPFCDTCPSKINFESEYSLEQLINKLLTFSNNFIANQIMLAMGAKVYGPPATLDKGVRVLKDFAAQDLNLQHVILAEGSGISRTNKISADQMLKLLETFKPYYQLLKKGDKDYYKTGTLSDVRTRAGYFIGKDGQLYPYVIMLNDTSTGYEKIYEELNAKVAQDALKKR